MQHFSTPKPPRYVPSMQHLWSEILWVMTLPLTVNGPENVGEIQRVTVIVVRQKARAATVK